MSLSGDEPPPTALYTPHIQQGEPGTAGTASTNAIASTTAMAFKKMEERSPAYLARSTHYDGNIVVTSDDRGVIKVFRQDCAAQKRRHECWDSGSAFSKKQGANGVGGFAGAAAGFISGFGRTGSVRTRGSAGSVVVSRRGSMSQNGAGIVLPSGVQQPQQHAMMVGAPSSVNSDRILSWRQGIENGTDKTGRGTVSKRGLKGGTTTPGTP